MLNKIKLTVLITVLSILITPVFGRDAIAENEKSTVKKLGEMGIVTGEYTPTELNNPISKIDAMSMNIKTYSRLDNEKADMSDISNLYKNMIAQSDHLNDKADRREDDKIRPMKSDIKQLKAQADMNVFLWVTIFLLGILK